MKHVYSIAALILAGVLVYDTITWHHAMFRVAVAQANALVIMALKLTGT